MTHQSCITSQGPKCPQRQRNMELAPHAYNAPCHSSLHTSITENSWEH